MLTGNVIRGPDVHSGLMLPRETVSIPCQWFAPADLSGLEWGDQRRSRSSRTHHTLTFKSCSNLTCDLGHFTQTQPKSYALWRPTPNANLVRKLRLTAFRQMKGLSESSQGRCSSQHALSLHLSLPRIFLINCLCPFLSGEYFDPLPSTCHCSSQYDNKSINSK